MKLRIILITVLGILTTAILMNCAQSRGNEQDIRLIIRGDDIGSFHAANIGCIKSYRDGIMRTVEIMVPCPWYPEAVKMLNENPGLDVGIHLVMTSEWENMKWRPLTGMSSFTDEQGYFFPMVWPNDIFGPEQTFRESGWELDDVEKELRAQIELAIEDIKSVSHISTHMGFASADESIDSLVNALAEEYELDIDPGDYGVKRFSFDRSREQDLEEWVSSFTEALDTLESGTYMFVEHPALKSDEMQSIGHTGYSNVGMDRQKVTDLFTNNEVIKKINKLGIELISYADLE